ncbi:MULTISPECIES: CAP domain-containing protein [unclassified Streptomyces]|uniref:CAP domain-containing protein n=1 Tax=unclassified Streptomyces TaxID=2593676 RepID=UPI0011E695E8|nr:CAP domain-containing protein [Streptomyces sp. sk2.1]TXS68310.1 CAP domain-containing protein [Streptomyces sp. sk2.1]
MGRHSRSAAVPAPGNGETRPRGHRRKRSASPIRTGMVGVSAALAVGAVAMSSGLLPGGGGTYTIGGGPSDRVRPEGNSDLLTRGGTASAPAGRGTASDQSSRGIDRSDSLKKAESSTPSAFPSRTPDASERSDDKAKPSRSAGAAESKASRSSAPAAGKSSAAPKSSASTPAARRSMASAPASSSAQAAVLALVNQERSKVGCSPLTASSSLASLAQDFSRDMAARGFFDHTDPDGRSPWDRASKAGVKGLAAENIARGQADAQAVMEAWMDSPGHRANILNCDYKTLGVGVHQGSGGPWWTQEFGF